MTWIYLKTSGWINMALRPFGLILMATFEGDPPDRPVKVIKLQLNRRSSIGIWK